MKFDIFIPNKKKVFPLTQTLLIAPIVLMIIHYLLSYFSIHILSEKIVFLVSFGCISFLFIRTAAVRGQIRPLHGKLNGELKFTDNDIYINGEKLDIEKIQNIEFHFVSYYSEYQGQNNPMISPYRENGTNNWIDLKYYNGENEIIHFQRMHENAHTYLKPIFESLYYKDKLSFLRLTELVGINKYEDIQKYKHELNQN